MKKFMDDDFLIDTQTAKELYELYADMTKIPVIDYHCHIDPKEIFEDRKYSNITQVWLGCDHYKWRQMRTCGVDEKYITGDAPDRDKFQKWAETLPMLIGNPLYHWSHMELKYYFGYKGDLNPDTAEYVWNLCNGKLGEDDFTVRNLIRRSNVKLICTTDDPADSLIWHRKIKDDESFDVQVLPAWRPDRVLNIEKAGFGDYIAKLSDVSAVGIKDIASLKEALTVRLDHFGSCGCRVSDHGLGYIKYAPADEGQIEKIFKDALAGADISEESADKFRTYMLVYLADQYEKRDWVMQIHYGCKRDNNTYMFEKTGADTGFDCILNDASSAQLADLLNAFCRDGKIPKTIIYSLNPNDDQAVGSVIGCFQGGGVRSRIQQGSAWWFNDNITGMTDQITSYANLSALGNFIGMLTDSRSFLSYARHDYFRRILCHMIGGWVEKGEYPYNKKLLGEIIKGIAYNNAVEYFGFDLERI